MTTRGSAAGATRFAAAMAAVLVASAPHASRADAPATTAGPAQAAGEATAAAPDPGVEARQQYNAGMQAYQAKRFVEAALHFEAAAAQRPHAVTLYTAALAWEQANRPERAADDFGRALDVPGLDAKQTTNARERLASLEKTMGTLDVAAPQGWRVQLDAFTEVTAPARLHATPGVHTLAVRAPDKPIVHRDVTLELGKTTHLDLSETDVAPPPKVEPPPRIEVRRAPEPPPVVVQKLDLRRAAGAAALGLGVGALAAGVVLGVSALDARAAYDAGPTRAAYDHASSLQTWTDVAFVTGGVFALGGAALLLWPAPKRATDAPPASGGSSAASGGSSARVTLAPSLGGAVLRGAF